MRMATTHSWAVSSRFCLGRGRGAGLDRAAVGAASCRIRSERFAAKCRRCVRVMAAAEEPARPEMSFESALELLGVREGASFDEILQAKKALMEKSSGDQERALQVEAAYDALLMRRLMKRRAGEVADSTVLYADVRKRSSSSSASKSGGIPGVNWLKGALANIPVTIEAPTSNLLATQTAVYGGLVAWTYFSGMDSSSSFGGGVAADSTGVTLAIGFGASLYFLRQQNLKLGKAAAIATAGLVAGALVGNVLESWLRVDIVPVAGISSPAVMVSECVLLSLWLVSLYLR
ncbi:protein CHAPERONE-LIKE PROTEIN OF POR1, chloroplastic [Selaginella moellendorffii]|nr:protein CHAPERONE-LIKE PROTEIN OF POR1, chloroplastic [Selaginella moellendorffii]|eukprot:XP_002964652.2 protein CHAPERONE-LIKE PROTEIN OF POR1, chloroplastic [Selaginella moellendorffii]